MTLHYLACFMHATALNGLGTSYIFTALFYQLCGVSIMEVFMPTASPKIAKYTVRSDLVEDWTDLPYAIMHNARPHGARLWEHCISLFVAIDSRNGHWNLYSLTLERLELMLEGDASFQILEVILVRLAFASHQQQCIC